MAQVSRNRDYSQKKSQNNLSKYKWLAVLLSLFILFVSIAYFSSPSWSAYQKTISGDGFVASSSPSEILGPNDWTAETPIKIFNRRNGQWENATFGDVKPDTEFIVNGHLFATTEGTGYVFLKPEINITKLSDTDRPFDPDNWRVPTAKDVVFLLKTPNDQQQKGHWLLPEIQPGSEFVFQGKVWRLEYDIANNELGVVDTRNVFARVTETHANFHEDDVLALTVIFDTCGKSGVITGSEEHPFYVLDIEDYLPMVDLQPDMRLKTDNGSLATVVELKPLDKSLDLYNLTVEHVHNYYIYTSVDDTGILVHNTNCGGKIPLIGGGTNLPAGVQWADVNKLEHPPWNPPTGADKLNAARENLANGFDPNHALGIIIEPDGRMIVAEGNHRLYVAAKEMGYDEIPIRILLDKR